MFKTCANNYITKKCEKYNNINMTQVVLNIKILKIDED